MVHFSFGKLATGQTKIIAVGVGYTLKVYVYRFIN